MFKQCNTMLITEIPKLGAYFTVNAEPKHIQRLERCHCLPLDMLKIWTRPSLVIPVSHIYRALPSCFFAYRWTYSDQSQPYHISEVSLEQCEVQMSQSNGCGQEKHGPTPHLSSQLYTAAALQLLTQADIRPLSKLIQFHKLAEN